MTDEEPTNEQWLDYIKTVASAIRYLNGIPELSSTRSSLDTVMFCLAEEMDLDDDEAEIFFEACEPPRGECIEGKDGEPVIIDVCPCCANRTIGDEYKEQPCRDLAAARMVMSRHKDAVEETWHDGKPEVRYFRNERHAILAEYNADNRKLRIYKPDPAKGDCHAI
jgi:hypothetical protein